MRTNLKVFRVRMHLSQAEMAAKIGNENPEKYSRQVYSLVESGKTNGKQEFWDDLMRAFDLDAYQVWQLMKYDNN